VNGTVCLAFVHTLPNPKKTTEGASTFSHLVEKKVCVQRAFEDFFQKSGIQTRMGWHRYCGKEQRSMLLKFSAVRVSHSMT
jgi:hypothetical protein